MTFLINGTLQLPVDGDPQTLATGAISPASKVAVTLIPIEAELINMPTDTGGDKDVINYLGPLRNMYYAQSATAIITRPPPAAVDRFDDYLNLESVVNVSSSGPGPIGLIDGNFSNFDRPPEEHIAAEHNDYPLQIYISTAEELAEGARPNIVYGRRQPYITNALPDHPNAFTMRANGQLQNRGEEFPANFLGLDSDGNLGRLASTSDSGLFSIYRAPNDEDIIIHRVDAIRELDVPTPSRRFFFLTQHYRDF